MMMHLEVYSISEVAKMEIVGDPIAWPTQAFPGRKGFNRGGVDGYLEIHSGIKLFGQDLSLAVER